MKSSYWLNASTKKKYDQLTNDLEVDILVVGGGITGILCAYRLAQNKNLTIALIEKNELYHSTTGYTTGKITFQHDDIYHRLIKSKNEAIAKLYYEANNQAVNEMIDLIEKTPIDCDFQKTDAFLYAMANNNLELNNLEKERKAYVQLSIPHEWTNEKRLPLKTQAFLRVFNQGAFHVVKFLDHLLREMTDVLIYENTKIIKTNQINDYTIATTSKGHKIKAKHLILATHYPFYQRFNFFFTILKPTVSYALVIDKYVPFEDGAYINLVDPIVSIRLTYGSESKLLMAGFGHDSNQFRNYQKQIEKLKLEGTYSFNGILPESEWYNQDYQSTDLIPLIGRIKNTNIYMASAYNKWGMSSSFLASMIISDLIIKGNNRFEEVFSPNRSFIKLKTIWYNIKMGFTIIRTKIMLVPRKKQLPKGVGAVLGKGITKIGIYLDEQNKMHLVKPVCTHLGCTLRFNNVSKTYECPCHGSRFNYDGVAIDGPAPRNLKKY